MRSSDYVFRYGGEEFMLVFVETTERQALRIIDAIREKIAATPVFPADEGTVGLTISIGLCAFDGHPDYARKIKKANDALYLAKQNGRNRTEDYHPD